MLRFITIILLGWLPLQALAQDGTAILEQMMNKWNLVKDYSVQVNIKSEIPLIKSFPVKATIYFKQKDQFRMVSKGIAILPKQNFNELPKFLQNKGSYTALITGNESIQSQNTTVITVLPSDDSGDLVLLKLWIDPKTDLLYKSQTTTRSNGTISALYEYGSQRTFGLPDKMIFTVEVKKFKIPKGLATDINRTSTTNQPTPKNGKITILFSDYSINKGIKDEVFKK
jgi:outer membrane lipoprotein-sorting protein